MKVKRIKNRTELLKHPVQRFPWSLSSLKVVCSLHVENEKCIFWFQPTHHSVVYSPRRSASWAVHFTGIRPCVKTAFTFSEMRSINYYQSTTDSWRIVLSKNFIARFRLGTRVVISTTNYLFKIFRRFSLAPIPGLIPHNQPALTTFGMCEQ